RLAVGGGGDAAGHRRAGAAGFLDQADGPLELGPPPSGDHAPGALAREEFRRAPADAGAPARDQRPLPRQPHLATSIMGIMGIMGTLGIIRPMATARRRRPPS